jgi:hypothetical protein
MSALACKWARISPSDFYEIKEAFEKYGPEGLAPSGAWQAPDAESDTTRFRREASRDDGTLPHLQQPADEPAVAVGGIHVSPLGV